MIYRLATSIRWTCVCVFVWAKPGGIVYLYW